MGSDFFFFFSIYKTSLYLKLRSKSGGGLALFLPLLKSLSPSNYFPKEEGEEHY